MGLESKMAHAYVARSSVRAVEWSAWVLLHAASQCCLGSSWDCRKSRCTASLLPQSVAETYQDQLSSRGRVKDFLFMSHCTIQTHHICGDKKKQAKGLLVGTLNPMVIHEETSLSGLTPSKVQRKWSPAFGSPSRQKRSENFSLRLDSVFKGA